MKNAIGGFWRQCIARTNITKKGQPFDATTCAIVPAEEAKRGWSVSTVAEKDKRRALRLSFFEGVR